MGHNMNIYWKTFHCKIIVKAEHVDDAYNALCKLNARHDLKRVGTSKAKEIRKETAFFNNELVMLGLPIEDPNDTKNGSYGNPDIWFSHMDWNYDETCKTLKEIFEHMGFKVENMPNGDVAAIYYENFAGVQSLFFDRIAPYVTDDSFAVWLCKRGQLCKWEFSGGKLRSYQLPKSLMLEDPRPLSERVEESWQYALSGE